MYAAQRGSSGPDRAEQCAKDKLEDTRWSRGRDDILHLIIERLSSKLRG